VVVGDGVDDELVDVEFGGHVEDVGFDLVGGAYEVAGELGAVGLLGTVLEEFDGGFFGGGYGASVVHADAELKEADGEGEALGFELGFGADDADGGYGFGLFTRVSFEFGVGAEAGLVVLDGGAGAFAGEEVGEGVGEAELGGGGGAPHARAEEPDVWGAGGFGRDGDAGKRVAGGEAVVEEGDELGELVGEVVALEGVRGRVTVAAKRGGFDGATTGGTADAEVDAAGVEGE